MIEAPVELELLVEGILTNEVFTTTVLPLIVVAELDVLLEVASWPFL